MSGTRVSAFLVTNTRTPFLRHQQFWVEGAACLQNLSGPGYLWLTPVILQTPSGSCFHKSQKYLLPPPYFTVLSLCHNNSHHMWLPWQAEEALLRKIRAETLTPNSTFVVYFFSLEFLVFYDLLHLPVNSKWFPDGSGLYPIPRQQRSSFSLITSSNRKEKKTKQNKYQCHRICGPVMKKWCKIILTQKNMFSTTGILKALRSVNQWRFDSRFKQGIPNSPSILIRSTVYVWIGQFLQQDKIATMQPGWACHTHFTGKEATVQSNHITCSGLFQVTHNRVSPPDPEPGTLHSIPCCLCNIFFID